MSSREQFEAWLSSEYPWGNEALDKAFFSGDDDNGYYTGGDFIYDGSSCADALFWAWRGWQESHKRAEAKCAALAAENGQMLRLLTDISENHDEYVNQDEYLYAGIPMDYVSEINAYVSRDVEAENPFIATDSFLAEVRASELPADVMAAIQKVARIRLDLNDFDGDKRGIVDCLGEAEESLIEVVSKFAAQLRHGGAE